MGQTIDGLIVLTYPFIILSSLITSGVVMYSLVKTMEQRSSLILWWFLIGVFLVSSGLAIENSAFMYSQIYGESISDMLAGNVLIYAIKLGYVFGMWIHFCAALSAIKGRNITIQMIIGGLIVWAFVYTILVLNFAIINN